MTPPGFKVSFWGDENVLELVVTVAQVFEYTKDHRVVHFKWVNFVVCELYPNKYCMRKEDEVMGQQPDCMSRGVL